MTSADNVVIRLIKASGLIGFSLFLLVACGFGGGGEIRFTGSTMGTIYHVTIVDLPYAIEQAQLEQEVAQILNKVDQQMSTYKADSELSLFNQAEIGTAVKVSSDTRAVVEQAVSLAVLSGGSFNPAIAPLVNLWGFGPAVQQDSIPSASQIIEALQSVDYLSVQIVANSLTKLAPVTLDLSAIAKGFGVDKVADYLLTQGVANFLVEVGGEIRVGGLSPRQTPWRVGIESPGKDYGIAYNAISVTNAAVATSGDYRNYYEQDGKRYSHTIDPTTGYPIDHNLASVTVVADSAALADGLATAINVMGPDEGLAFSELNALAVFMIVKTETGYDAQYSSAFEPYVEAELLTNE
ncbi:MAG: thiamine biosynthesis lipoprotein [Pseudomonadales bacterium]|jgi:thiamine biosynthesis lipoprotein